MSTPGTARERVPIARGAPDPQIVVRLRHLQHGAGNAAVVRMLAGPVVTDRAAGHGAHEHAPGPEDRA
ncbi:hypothetical protein ACIO3O_41510 [Streptomyces sp. NPDC087440]|uniref:hypothetical protein n=1 Tax=Streptomyces sp. NPDC087440 TaxID=3365790 RepID=UPI003804A409